MSGSASQKQPFGLTINRAVKNIASSLMNVAGKSLPSSVVKVIGNLVQINFEITSTQQLPQPTLPVLMSRYFRFPIQPGDKGMTVTSDAYLGGMSGQGGGVADLTQRGNLGASAWAPLTNADDPTVDTLQATATGGPNGLLLKDQSGVTTILLTSSQIAASCGGHSLVINSSGVIIDGVVFLTHVHSGVSTGTGDTGPVVP